MELIEVVATAHFTDTRIGAVSRKQRLRLPVMLAEELESLSLVKPLNPHSTTATNPQQTAPQAVGGGESSVLSQAGQASQSETASSPERNKTGESSPSTTATGSAQELTRSTPATDSGGMSTQTPSETPASKVSSGRKTKAQRVVTD